MHKCCAPLWYFPSSFQGLHGEVTMKNQPLYLRRLKSSKHFHHYHPPSITGWQQQPGAFARVDTVSFSPHSNLGGLYLLPSFAEVITFKHCCLYVVLPTCCPTVSPVKALIWFFKHLYIALHLQSSVHVLIKLHAQEITKYKIQRHFKHTDRLSSSSTTGIN